MYTIIVNKKKKKKSQKNAGFFWLYLILIHLVGSSHNVYDLRKLVFTIIC